MPGNPITMHPFPRFTVPTQARLISAILKRREKVVFLPESERWGSFSTGLNNIVLMNLSAVVHIMEERGQSWITELLNTGLLVDLFRADALDMDALGRGTRSNRIDLYTIEKAGVEGKRRKEEWWDNWDRYRQKAFALRHMRRELGEEIETMEHQPLLTLNYA
ncbi:hypothetical protein PM082_019621 [Marasmius tenuissimus]|nr:hypothetical protein PM082_019621 [Marasmius tenuissimus]